MFSANENLQLRQYKRQVVQWIEATIPDSVLDLGVNVMVMQVTCKDPGCVPIETAMVIIFPKSSSELLPGLPESQGGSYKAKILKPMAQVTQQDVLEALPPAFAGGLRSTEKLCLQARDVMLGQITQLFDDQDGRQLMAQYLIESLQTYLERDCVAPEWGEPFPERPIQDAPKMKTTTGNIVLKRPVESSTKAVAATTTTVNTTTTKIPTIVNSTTSRRQQLSAETNLLNTGNPLSRLMEREHAPGIRRPGCPCCDPDHPSNIVDQMMQI